jgi:hypothetical protein
MSVPLLQEQHEFFEGQADTTILMYTQEVTPPYEAMVPPLLNQSWRIMPSVFHMK